MLTKYVLSIVQDLGEVMDWIQERYEDLILLKVCMGVYFIWALVVGIPMLYEVDDETYHDHE